MASQKGTRPDAKAKSGDETMEHPSKDKDHQVAYKDRPRKGERRDAPESDGGEDERLTFEMRAEWFLRYHTGQYNYLPLSGRRQAVEQALRMEKETFASQAPGGPAPVDPFELAEHGVSDRRILGEEDAAVRFQHTVQIKAVENPAPNSSFGFASGAVHVQPTRSDKAIEAEQGSESDNEPDTDIESGLNVVLKVRLDDRTLERVEPDSIRIFRFDPPNFSWQLVLTSGVTTGEIPETLTGKTSAVESKSAQANTEKAEAAWGRLYAWATLRQPGIYIAVGLPRHPLLQSLVTLLQDRFSQLIAAQFSAKTKELMQDITRLAIYKEGQIDLPAEEREQIPQPNALPDLGEPLDEFLSKFRMPLSGMPETQLLREIKRLALSDIFRDRRFWPYWFGWHPIGPDNINGRVKSLSLHPTNSNIVYAGAADGGVWRSNNAGLSWEPLKEKELSMAIGSVAVAPSNPSVIYAATGEDTPEWGPSYPGVGVYKSSNGGDSWTLCGMISSSRCTRVLVHPSNSAIVYVSGDGGMDKSTDGGATWTRVRSDHVSDVVMDPDRPDHLYAGVWNSGIYSSTDGGSTWNDMNSGLPAVVGWIKLSIGPKDFRGRPFLIAKLGLDGTQLYYYNYNAMSGSQLVRWPFPRWILLPGTHPGASYNEWTNLISVDPTNASVIIDGSVKLERSSNGGKTFAATGGTHDDHHALVFDRNNPNIAYLSTDGGVYRSSDNGASWTRRSNTLQAAQFYSIGVSQTDPLLVGGATQDQGIPKKDGSFTWTDTVAGNEGGFFIVDPRSSNNLYVTPKDGNLHRSKDGGSSWTTILNGITKVKDRSGNLVPVGISHLAVNPTSSRQLLCAGGCEVFRSTDQGDTWSSVLIASGSLLELATVILVTRVIWRRGGRVAYAATDSGRVYRSTNQGLSGSWSEPYTNANRPGAGTITCIDAGVNLLVSQIHSSQSETVYIGDTSGKIYRSDDSGSTWHDASGSTPGAILPSVPVNDLVIDPLLTSKVYAATDIGVFYTQDAGASWQPYNWLLPRVMTTGLALRKKDRTLYASTMGRGVYRIHL